MNGLTIKELVTCILHASNGDRRDTKARWQVWPRNILAGYGFVMDLDIVPNRKFYCFKLLTRNAPWRLFIMQPSSSQYKVHGIKTHGATSESN